MTSRASRTIASVVWPIRSRLRRRAADRPVSALALHSQSGEVFDARAFIAVQGLAVSSHGHALQPVPD